MPVIGITGGVATGKSTFTRALHRRLPGEVFDADQAAHALLEADQGVRVGVEAAFGTGIYNAEGRPNRSRLRDLVFSDAKCRKQLEAILHPAIRDRWIALGEASRRSRTWLLVDIPLLYETGAESHCDRVVVVGCTATTQRQRMETERGLGKTIAENIISAQLDLETKIKRADHLIWNDSTVACLDAQTDLLATWLTHYYGSKPESHSAGAA